MQHEFHACTVKVIRENIEKLREYVKGNEVSHQYSHLLQRAEPISVIDAMTSLAAEIEAIQKSSAGRYLGGRCCGFGM